MYQKSTMAYQIDGHYHFCYTPCIGTDEEKREQPLPPTIDEFTDDQLKAHLYGVIVYLDSIERSSAQKTRLSYYSLTHDQILAMTDVLFDLWRVQDIDVFLNLAGEVGQRKTVENGHSVATALQSGDIPPDLVDEQKWRIADHLIRKKIKNLPGSASLFGRKTMDEMIRQRKVERRAR